MQILAVSNSNLNQTTNNIPKNSPTKLQTLSKDTVSFKGIYANTEKIAFDITTEARDLIEKMFITTQEYKPGLNEVRDGIQAAIKKAKVTNKGLEGKHLSISVKKKIFNSPYLKLKIFDGTQTHLDTDTCLTLARDDKGKYAYDSITAFLERI